MTEHPFNPQLRAARFLPRTIITVRTLPTLRVLTKLTGSGVGTNDLFHDEDVTYARRLQQACVASTLHVVPGAYHNFDSFEAKAAASQAFVKAQTTALDEALNGG